MLPNPGGHLAPQDVVGRSRLIERLWAVLERQSIVLVAERRIGKTSIIRKMQSQPATGKLPVWHDVEGLRTRLEFVESVYGDVESHLSRARRTTDNVRAFLREIRGAEVGGLIRFPDAEKQHWKSILDRTFQDLATHKDEMLVFFWDEVPLMLQNIVASEGEAAAMELLDTLRALRQTYDSIRMVFTGSIGLHNVIKSLRAAGYSNRPTNDMYVCDVPALDRADAVDLARALLIGIDARCPALEATAAAIAGEVDCVPYYIHHVVNRIAFGGEEATAETVARIVRTSITDAHDPWDLRHYRERLNYYSKTEALLALDILDQLAVTEPLTSGELFELVKAGACAGDREALRNLLALLQADHYLIQSSEGRFSFRFTLIRRHWAVSRGLRNV